MSVPRKGYVVLEDETIKSGDKCSERGCSNGITSKVDFCCRCGNMYCKDHSPNMKFIPSEEMVEYLKDPLVDTVTPKKITEYVFEPDDNGRSIGKMQSGKVPGVFVCDRCYRTATGKDHSEAEYEKKDGFTHYQNITDFAGDFFRSFFG